MHEVYNLEKDQQRRTMFEGISSLPDDEREVDFPHGPIGSKQWWSAVSSGKLELHEVNGMVLSFDRQNQQPGSYDTFSMRSDFGPIHRWAAISNEPDAAPIFYRPGRGVKVVYARADVIDGSSFPVNQIVSIEVDDFLSPKIEGLQDRMKCVFSAADFPHFESILEKSKTPFGVIGSDSWWEATLTGNFKLCCTRGFISAFEPEVMESTGANIKVQDESGKVFSFRGFTTDDSMPIEVFVPDRRIQVLWFDATPYSKMLKGVVLVVFIDVYV